MKMNDKKEARVLQNSIRYVVGDRVLAFAGRRWHDGVVEGTVPKNWGYVVHVLGFVNRRMKLRRTAIIPLVNVPEWRIEFNTGDYVNFHTNGQTGWGKIVSVRDQGKCGEEYEVLPTQGEPIWIPEDFVWEKAIQGVHPECPICVETFDKTKRVSKLDCGHLHCEACTVNMNNCALCGEIVARPLQRIDLRFNVFGNLVCGTCDTEITNDMDVHDSNRQLLCCFCMQRNTAEALELQRIFVPSRE